MNLIKKIPETYETYFNISKERINTNIVNLNCNLKLVNGSYLNNKVTTNLCIICKNIEIQVAFFYKYGDYYWVGAEDENQNNSFKWFGDTPRGINTFVILIIFIYLIIIILLKLNRFELVTISSDSNNLKIFIPSPIKNFFFDYKQSKFIECNKKLSKLNNSKLDRNREKFSKVLSSLKYLTRNLERMEIRYSLLAGTVLGNFKFLN